MLQLSLEQGDYIVIGDNVKIRFSHLSERNRSMATLSIDAPKEVGILRGDLYEEMLGKMAAEGDQGAREEIKKVKYDRERYEQKRNESKQYHNQRRYEKLQEKHRLKAETAAIY